jgi:hypothetical protein
VPSANHTSCKHPILIPLTCPVAADSESSARLGTAGLDRTLIITSTSPSVPSPNPTDYTTQTRGRSRAGDSVRTRVHISNIDVSVVDATPEELLLVQAEDVHAEYDYNIGINANFARTSLCVKNFQVRDPWTWCTVYDCMACMWCTHV